MIIASILIVDDDPVFCEICRAILEAAGYEVVTAADTVQAMERIESVWPDLILMNLEMNRIEERLQFGERLHHDPILRHLPIVFVSPSADTHSTKPNNPKDVHYAAAWVPNPFSQHTLIQTIGSVLEQRM